MSRAVSYPKIYEAVLDGVNNAFKKYHKWSNGQWLNRAPEGFIQTEIANSLSKICPYITLEDTVQDILEDSNAEKRGPKPRGSAAGRVDIIVWWADLTPRILIEVKKAWSNNALTKDARRLMQLLNRGGSLQNGKGFIVVYTAAKKRKTIDDNFENMAYYSGTTLKRRIGPIRRKDDGEVWYWDAGCFSID